jgi:tryptophan halogenase
MNIVIVGGGTAGWLAATFFAKAQPNKHKVTLIESSQIGIIGAGEGSTGLMNDFLSNAWFDTGTDISKFMLETNSTFKLGIRHKNWTGDGSSYYAPLDGSITSSSNPDYHFLQTFYRLGTEEMHIASPMGLSFRDGIHPGNSAFHFDGTLIGQHFKKSLGNLVTVIDAVVDDVSLNEEGFIKSVELDNGQIVEGDLFIDCTGFSRTLFKKLNVSWHSYKQHLPVNTAIPFILPLPETPVEPLTVAHALSAGWMWQIPLTNRIGCGYVFSDEYTSVEDAQKEVETLLNQKITPIKTIKFESGRSEVLWEKNCLALGLSAAFAEPLEATSIHTTLVQLLTFTFEHLTPTWKTTYSKKSQDRYNLRMSKMYDDIKDFLVIHYRGNRKDSDFWNHMNSEEVLTPFASEVLEKVKHKVPGIFQYDYYYGCIGAPLWNWVLAGTGQLSKEVAYQELDAFNHTYMKL